MIDISSNPYLQSLTQEATNAAAESAAEASGEDDNELGQSAFLELMITQMKNQNPLDPQENSEFVAQLAQFSSVEGLDKLNNNFDSFASNFMSNQALQASSLVGTSVAVPTDKAILAQEGFVGGSITLPSSASDLTLSIYSEEGALIDEVALGDQEAGEIVLRWDGSRIEVNGELLDWESSTPATSGNFTFKATATQDGNIEQLATSLTANVNSVTVNTNNELILNLAGVGPVNINNVTQFN